MDKNIFDSALLFMQVSKMSYRMQADEAGFRETIPERKIKNAKMLRILAFFIVFKLGVPKGI